jgi:alkylated DNA repair dioxygenase AlkB
LNAFVDLPERFELEFDRVVSWAVDNRSAIHKAFEYTFGDLELVLDLPHSTYEFLKEGASLIRKGAVEVSPGDLSILPSQMLGDFVLVRATDRVTEILNSISHGTGRRMARGDCTGLADSFDFRGMRERVLIPTGVHDSSLRSDGPFAYRDLDECPALIEEYVEPVIRFSVVGHMGNLQLPQNKQMNNQPQVLIEDSFLPASESLTLFENLSTSVDWDDSMAARRTASFGRPYNYSNMQYPETLLPDSLHPIVELLNARLGIRFNNCLLNFYQTGDNSMGFHSDNTTGLVPGTGVAIVSLGSVREITFRFKAEPSHQVTFPMNPGSLLYMDDAVQQDWMHAIKKQIGAGPRISLTWRAIE